MGVFPIIMNIVQFWLIDSIVKASATIVPPHQDCDPLLNAPAVDDNEQPTLETANRRSVSSLDSRDPEPHLVTSYQTIITIPVEQESGASSSRCLIDTYAYRDRPSVQGSANHSSKSFPLVVQTSSPRFSAA